MTCKIFFDFIISFFVELVLNAETVNYSNFSSMLDYPRVAKKGIGQISTTISVQIRACLPCRQSTSSFSTIEGIPYRCRSFVTWILTFNQCVIADVQVFLLFTYDVISPCRRGAQGVHDSSGAELVFRFQN